jgi:hypothetical protein
MKNLIIGLLIGILIGFLISIGIIVLDNMSYAWANSYYEVPQSDYNYEQPEEETRLLDVKLQLQGANHGNYV